MICASDWVTAGELIKIIKTYSKYLPLILSNETVVSNVIRRVLKIIREENEGPDATSFSEGLAIFFKSDSKSSTIGRLVSLRGVPECFHFAGQLIEQNIFQYLFTSS